MIKQIVISVILAYNMLPQLVFAEELKKIFQEPITFNAKVGFEEEFPYFGVQIFDLKEFNRVLPLLNEWQESYVKNIISAPLRR